MHFYVLDTETTGLSVAKHEVTQISIVRYSDRHQLNRYIKALYPERASPEALRVTGRTMFDLAKGVSREEAVEACEAFLNEDGATPEHRCIIGHNVSFDRRFVHELWASVKKTFPATCWLDTMNSAKDFMIQFLGLTKPKKGLNDALMNCGLKPRDNAHNAIADVRNTYILHAHMIKQGFDLLPYIKRVPHEVEISEELVESETKDKDVEF